LGAPSRQDAQRVREVGEKPGAGLSVGAHARQTCTAHDAHVQWPCRRSAQLTQRGGGGQQPLRCLPQSARPQLRR